ncbi:hypothetical protein VTL71DRAFT_14160 [Oculimacula yallundae]|uniref:Uncharacterized protein n=1 Tax=Oculimacula yallundae TaxID=86028 RepID=A0ABR4CJS3_9HELO
MDIRSNSTLDMEQYVSRKRLKQIEENNKITTEGWSRHGVVRRDGEEEKEEEGQRWSHDLHAKNMDALSPNNILKAFWRPRRNPSYAFMTGELYDEAFI